VLCQDLEGISAAHTVATQWLADMGVHLSPTKTRITPTSTPYDGNLGLDFLGFAIRHSPAGRTHASRLKGTVSTGLLVRITPSKDAVKRHIKDLNETVRQMRTAAQDVLIAALNVTMRGWCLYYCDWPGVLGLGHFSWSQNGGTLRCRGSHLGRKRGCHAHDVAVC